MSTATAYDSVRKLLEIKSAASTAISKTDRLADIIRKWESDDEDFVQRALEVQLSCEDVERDLRTIYIKTDNLISQPPAYDAYPDDRHNRITEIDINCTRAVEEAEGLRLLISRLRNDANDAPDIRLRESEERGYSLAREVAKMAIYSEELCMAEQYSRGMQSRTQRKVRR